MAGSGNDLSVISTRFIDSDADNVRDFTFSTIANARSNKEKAVRLYYAVRDQIRYDPYRLDLSPDGMAASTVLTNGYGWCVPKAALLAAACRAADIPARLGFADVCNHMSTTRMTEMLGSDIFYYHGYTSILIEGNWVKATPAFNQQLCEISGLLPLEFDGETDSIFHPFDKAGKRHMEYLNYRGEFDDVPFDDLIKTFAEKYPNLQALDSYSWDKDIAEEQIHRP